MRNRYQRKRKFVPYHEYIKSDAWKAERQRYIDTHYKNGNTKCRLCQCFGPIQVHHRSYASLGDEHLGHLWGVCDWCHKLIHELCPCTDGKSSKIPTRMARSWVVACQNSRGWELRRSNPEAFRLSAQSFLRTLADHIIQSRRVRRKNIEDKEIKAMGDALAPSYL
jgi:hypothetical protein